jgi:glycine hydroxymethyltransferase
LEASPSTSPNAEGFFMTQSTLHSFFSTDIREIDLAIAAAITNELGRQRDEIEQTASEDIVSHAVMKAQG